jgi:hypothetical protein
MFSSILKLLNIIIIKNSILSTFAFAFILLASTYFTPNKAQAETCYDIQGGKLRQVMGIPACLCGSGLECLCVTEKPCPIQ